MKAVLNLSRRTSYADYLSAAQSSARRLEFIDGVIVAMAGGSYEHNAIAGHFAGILAARAAPGCLYYTPDQRFWIESSDRARYSDGSILCGKPTRPDCDRQAATNPVIVIEVLSPTSEGDDAGDKRRDFQSLASLQTYVLVAQDARCVKVYRRTRDGGWPVQPDVYRDDQRFEPPSLTGAIAVDELYRGVLDATGRSLLT